MRRLLLILLAICLFAGASACNFIKRPPTGGDVTAPVPGPAAPDTGEGPAATACEEIALRFSEDEWPRVDGATAFLPFYQEMAARMLGISSEEAGKKVLCSTTDWAYPYLHQGKVDIVFCLRPSADQVLEAANAGVRFEEVPFANEGFVFFVNKNNPVDSLSVQQLHDIYAGKITNWKEVGGLDEPIIAYQRTEGSGSQTGLYLHVISPDEIMEPPTERRIGTMGAIVDAVAGYKDAEGALGYSYRYFVTNLHYDEKIKMLKVEGVYPDYESVADGSYPLISDVCAVYRSDEPAGSAARRIAAWCASSQGAALAKELGYVPTAEALATLYGSKPNEPRATNIDYAVGKPAAEPYTGILFYENNINVEYVTVSQEDYSNYIRISGLKNKSVEQDINRQIREKFYELYENTELPPYVGIEAQMALFNDPESTGDRSASAFYVASFNNMLSVRISIRYSNFQETSTGSVFINLDDCHTLNFDLNTGKLIKFTDLFPDGMDGLAYVNSLISDYAQSPDSAPGVQEPFEYFMPQKPRFISAFRGIDENQKYYIDGSSGDLVILFDYENPEVFCSDFMPSEFRIPMLGINAYDKRFMGNTSLFEDERPSPLLFMRSYPIEDAMSESYYLMDDEWIGEDYPIYFDFSSFWNKSLPEAHQRRLQFSEEEIAELKARAIECYDKHRDSYSSLSGGASFNSHFFAYGDYLNIFRYAGFWIMDENWGEVDSYSTSEHLCFKGDSDRPLGLNDLFKGNVDMYAVMYDAAVANAMASAGYVPSWFEDAFREVVTNLEGFAVQGDQISLQCSKSYNILEQYTTGDEVWIFANSVTFLRYRELGMENLTIFD